MAEENGLICIFLCVYFHIHFRVTFLFSFFIWCAVKTLLFSGRVQSNSWGICRNTVITLQLVQALVPLARSLGAHMGKAFCLSVATPCVQTVILLFLKIQNNCVTGSMCVGFNLQRKVVVICYQNLVLFLRREYLFVPLEKDVCLCFSPDWMQEILLFKMFSQSREPCCHPWHHWTVHILGLSVAPSHAWKIKFGRNLQLLLSGTSEFWNSEQLKPQAG